MENISRLNSNLPNWQPTLPGPRITLRPLEEKDFDDLYSVASDPLIWDQHPNPDRYQRDVFRKFFDYGLESQGALVILRNSDSKIIGSSRYCDYRPEKKDIEIGFTFLSRECWGGSINAELKALMLNHAFRFVDSVRFNVGLNNFRSKRALEKIGAKLTGVFETSLPEGGTRLSEVWRTSEPPAFSIRIDIKTQTAALLRENEILSSYKISAALNGVGFEPGTNTTPTGRFRVHTRIGDDAPPGTVFRSRARTGEIYSTDPTNPLSNTAEDLVLTRILWLEGCDPENLNTLDRYIYFHGTNQEHLLGTPASHGCIRFSNSDITPLYNVLSTGSRVVILP